jgi:hypothetical protein
MTMTLPCGKYIYPGGSSMPGMPCEKPAKTYYLHNLHNHDVCCYCEEHDYQCGEQISEDVAVAYIEQQEREALRCDDEKENVK